MARTILHEGLNVQPDVIEAQLAHAVQDPLQCLSTFRALFLLHARWTN